MISAGELAGMRREVERTFVHTYTRTPRLSTADNPATPTADESQDAWGSPAVTFGSAQPGRPCKYRERSTPVVTPNGLVNVNVPVLLVPSSDQIAPGDQVSQVVDAYGTVFVAGPVEVEDVSPRGTIAGGPLHLEAQLRQALQI